MTKFPVAEYINLFGEPTFTNGGVEKFWVFEEFLFRVCTNSDGWGWSDWRRKTQIYSLEEVLGECSDKLRDKIIFNLDLFL